MSIKSTEIILREEAISNIKMYYEQYIKDKDFIDSLIEDEWDYSYDYLEESIKKAKKIFDGFDDFDDIPNEELESIIQCMDDLTSFGLESFNNYIVEG